MSNSVDPDISDDKAETREPGRDSQVEIEAKKSSGNLELANSDQETTEQETLKTEDSSTPDNKDNEEDLRILREQEAISKAASATTLEEVHETYVELTSLFNKKTADASRTIRHQLASRLNSSGFPLTSLDTFVVTWNVGNAAPNPEQLEKLIPTAHRLYDIVAVGFQECDYELDSSMASRATDYIEKRKVQRKVDAMVYQTRDAWCEMQPIKTSLRHELDAENDKDSQRLFVENDAVKKKHFSVGKFFRKQALSAEKTAKRAMTSKAGAHFASLIHDHLGVEDYFMVRECELMQMRLFVFARIEHRKRITHVEYASQATGIGGYYGNKGGVAVSFRFQDMRLCFISCHLAAHRKHLTERNRDCYDILGMIQSKLATRSASYLSDWDCVFFFGDLNYRLRQPMSGQLGSFVSEAETAAADNNNNNERLIDESPKDDTSAINRTVSEGGSFLKSSKFGETQTPNLAKRSAKADHQPEEREEILAMIQEQKWFELMAKDQLRAEQEAGRALMGFRESLIYPFAPTFKVSRNPFIEYNDKRLPAYCDRILWHTTPGLSVEHVRVNQKELFCPIEVSTSDHKPVCSLFQIALRPQRKTLRDHSRGFLGGYFRQLSDNQYRKSRGMQICIWRLKATNLQPMDLSGTADPYIIAYSTELFGAQHRGRQPMKSRCRTKVRFKSLNCSWDDTLFLRCPSTVARPEDLLGKHITLSLWDFDTFSRDDHIGEVVLSLDGAVHAFLQSSAYISEKFEARPSLAILSPQPEASQNPALPHAHLFDESLASGEQISLGQKQLAFISPIIRGGKVSGTLSGLIAIFRPEERLKVTQLNALGWTWKCLAYTEQVARPTLIKSKSF